MENIAPQVVFTLFNIPVRDTVVSTWVVMGLITLIAILIGRRKPVMLEILVDFLTDLISDLMGRPAAPYLPLLGALAIFIAFANIIGIVPFLRSPTSDINSTLALALVVFLSVHFFGIRNKGFSGYLRDLASPIFLLPLELIGQLSRTISLTLRLFGNTLSAVLIVAIIFSLAPLFVPLPLIAFGIFTGILQAYIFTALAAVYIASGLEVIEPNKEESKEKRKE